MNKYLEDVASRWKPIKVEIGSVQTMLEEVINYWKRYNACVDIFTVWLADGEKMLQRSPEERRVRKL